MTNIDSLCINTIRTLAVDGVEKAKSGHPGMPMGAASMAYVLWTKYLCHHPQHPQWLNRDRFVLSAGHGSMLLYSLLHLTGYDVSLDDLKNFRQWNSKTPGHPEYGHVPGVELTTGPLGQGFATGVGMAIAERYLAARYNRQHFDIVDYRIFGIVSDGDLMEGISAEAASLAGHLKLHKLIYLYDDNHISIEGDTKITFTEDVHLRFQAYGWNVLTVNDGNNLDEIDAALKQALQEDRRPTLIKVRTHIGFGSPNKQDHQSSHGAPLGAEEIKLTKKNLGWDPDKTFFVPDEVARHFRKAIETGETAEKKWNDLFADYRKSHPELAKEFTSLNANELGETWKNALPVFTPENGSIGTRNASAKVLTALSPHLPGLIGGSADLAESNLTHIKDAGEFQAGSYAGKNFHFGIREHAMGAILNGIALTKGMIPYGGTFLVFADYMRPAIRLAALMGIRPIYVFTHDSIGLGEDGPTHQPIEQIASLRAIPNVLVLRPADANETSEAYKVAIEHTTGPVAIMLTRQKTVCLDRKKFAPADNLRYGAYMLAENSPSPEIILIGTGSEVGLVIGAYEQLIGAGIKTRVVSMPSWELFERQSNSYKESVFPSTVRYRIVVEAGSSMGWHKYVGNDGECICLDHFGASAPYEVLYKEFGFTVENIVHRTKGMLQTNRAT
jgi:transketolase